MPNLNKFLALAQQLSQQAFQIMGDLAVTVTYTNVIGTPAYDVTTGITTSQTKVYTFQASLSRLAIDEVDPKVSSRSSTESIRSPGVVTTDAKLTCAFLDLPIQPTTQDTLTVASASGGNTGYGSYTWKVNKVLSPPGSPIWSLAIKVI